MKKRFLFLILVFVMASLLVSCGNDEKKSANYKSIDDFEGKTVASIEGAVFYDALSKRIGKFDRQVYKDVMNAVLAVKYNKADIAIEDSPVARVTCAKNKDLCIFPEMISEEGYAVMFQKESEYADKFSQVMTKFKEDGTTENLQKKWFVADYEGLSVEPQKSTGKNGTLNMVVIDNNVPMTFVNSYGENVGYEIELVYRICDQLDIKANIISLTFDSAITGMATKKFDAMFGSISVTKEREKKYSFSPETFRGGVVAICRRTDLDKSLLEKVEEDEDGLLEKIVSSIKSTFVIESRWTMFVRGLLVTLFISFGALVGGGLLAILILVLGISKSRIFNRINKIYLAVFRGTPILVVLLILYYVVFQSGSIPGEVIAIVAFGLNEAAFFSIIYKTAIDSVSKGEVEAALALGYTPSKAFLKIVLPQAIEKGIPVFASELISMIKMTSVVGFVAVQDLTKVGDIIRGMTFEAFTPLLSIAIVYFLFTLLVTKILTMLERRISPKFKKRVIKGVKADD